MPRPLHLTLICGGIASCLYLGFRFLHHESHDPDRTVFEGKGGTALIRDLDVQMPDLPPVATTPLRASMVLNLLGSGRPIAESLLGSPQANLRLADGRQLLVWHGCTTLHHAERGQWPVAHAAAVLDPSGLRIVETMLIGSLGRILETNPGPPGYERMHEPPR